VNAEQASKRTMRRPTRRPVRGRLIRLGYERKSYAQPLRRGSGDSMYTRKAHATRESPFDAFLLLRGLRTLDLRVSAQCQTAALLAERLRVHPAIKAVLYPGLPDHPGHAIAARQMSGWRHAVDPPGRPHAGDRGGGSRAAMAASDIVRRR
jgi:hypothetical protein